MKPRISSPRKGSSRKQGVSETLLKLSTAVLLVALSAACTTSPTNRRQVVLYSEAEMARQGEGAYRQMRSELPMSSDPRETTYVQCVADHVIAALEPTQQAANRWEVTVFESPQANAFALPGGKIGVYTGLFDVAYNQDQLAAVMAHEVGHVLAKHGNERASRSALRRVSIAAARVLGASKNTMQTIDFGTQLGLQLPFGRAQESEADAMGLMLMARAGFDPEQSIVLWENMSSDPGPRPPEFLATHPSPETRITTLRNLMDQALSARVKALSSGLVPDCIPGVTN
jgi:predicted Zn-dependent protease